MQFRVLQYLSILGGGGRYILYSSSCHCATRLFCKHKHVDIIHFNDPLIWFPNRSIFLLYTEFP